MKASNWGIRKTNMRDLSRVIITPNVALTDGDDAKYRISIVDADWVKGQELLVTMNREELQELANKINRLIY